MQSTAERLANLPPNERAQALALLSDAEAKALLYDWRGFLARPAQIAPDGDWDIWLALAGRGWGKTEVGAQWVRERVKNGARSVALVAETSKDLEEVMAQRIIAVHPPDEAPIARFRPLRMTWPNGAVAYGYNGTEPNQLRGPEFDTAWVDELAKYRYARETWDMLQFTMRSGVDPRICVTTTPRPIELIKAIFAGQEGKVVISQGKTAENRANLAASFLERIHERYAGTRLGRQELDAEILGDLPGALWSLATLDLYRVPEAPQMGRIVVAVDPAVTSEEDSDEHGIIVAGKAGDQRGVLLEDGSLRGTPYEWARRAVSLSKSWGADGIVVEVNQGGDMVASTIRAVDPNINIIEVRASRAKHIRAEPIAALYEQGRIVHVGAFPELESQMVQFTTAGYQGDGSPDRADALVWAFTELFPDMTDVVPDYSNFDVPARSGGWLGA